MLTKEQIKIITAIVDANKRVAKVWVFGSFARNEERPDSDIDLLFSFKENQSFGYIEYFKLQEKLEKSLQRKVELISEDSLLPFAKTSSYKDRILIYGS